MNDRFRRLRIYNFVMGAFHAAQGAAILALANDFALPVTASFMDGPPGSAAPELTQLFEVRVAHWVAAFVFLSALAHWILAGPAFSWYVKSLEKYRNYARWFEYSISSSIMIVLIAMLTGIGDVAALVALFGVNSSMILFGWLMEKYEEPGNPSWLGYWFGVIAGAVPWIAIGIYLLSPTVDSSPPAFVYGIFISLFIFFNTFAINMVLQYKRVGPWRDYITGESVYVALSLVSKSALAWQVFGGTLAT